MARRQGNIIRFWRGPRRHPKWHMGMPPGGRRPRRRISDPIVYLKLIMLGAAAGLMVLPFLADALGGALRPAAGAEMCRVVQVIDGDTVSLWCPARGVERARITGYDTPELFSPSCPSELLRAWKAKWQLRWLILTAGEVRSVRTGTDRYGRALVSLFVDGRNVSQEMIAAGNARPYDGGRRQSWCL
jgi:micrococcal nuclease